MGYGKKLKELLDERNMTVKQLARACGMAPTTLYSIINRDTNIRFDSALRIANVLQVPIETICDDVPYDPETTLPIMIRPRHFPLYMSESEAKKNYIKYRTAPVIALFDYTYFPTVDSLLSKYFTLDDEARDEILKIIDMKAETHTDQERKEKLKTLKK